MLFLFQLLGAIGLLTLNIRLKIYNKSTIVP